MKIDWIQVRTDDKGGFFRVRADAIDAYRTTPDGCAILLRGADTWIELNGQIAESLGASLGHGGPWDDDVWKDVE